MSTLSIRLTRRTKEFIEEQARIRGRRSGGAFISAILERERREWEEEIDKKLLEGMRSKASPMTAKNWEELHEKLKRSIAKRRRHKEYQ
jgi:hypothetical protein